MKGMMLDAEEEKESIDDDDDDDGEDEGCRRRSKNWPLLAVQYFTAS
jgi:hypothetical protein